MEIFSKENITLVGSVLAGTTSIWLFVERLYDRHRSIHVNFGPSSPRVNPTWDLYIVNRGSSKVRLLDFGFILKDGSKFSIPDFQVNEDDGSTNWIIVREGSTILEPRDHYELGVNINIKAIGAYAITTTQRFPRVDMEKSKWRIKILYIWIKTKFSF